MSNFSVLTIAMLVLICISVVGMFIVAYQMRVTGYQLEQIKHGDKETLRFENIRSAVDKREAIRGCIAPNGVDTYPLGYMTIEDSGHPVYIRCFTINEMPKTTTFASTFMPLITFTNVRTVFFVSPEPGDVTVKKLDKHVTILDSEEIKAAEKGERNRQRKLNSQLHETEHWVSQIEDGYERFYRFTAVFVLCAKTLEELNTQSDLFYTSAKEKTIELTACYSLHPEAFLSSMPLNKQFMCEWGPIQENGLKTHKISQDAIIDIFCHTDTDFVHASGVPLGYNMDTFRPFMFDPYYKGHTAGFSMIVAGKTGSGKSTFVKGLCCRLASMDDYHFVAVDGKARGGRGEYCAAAEVLNGVIYTIGSNSTNILNLFDIDKQTVFDEVLEQEFEVLHVNEKVSEVVSNIMAIVQGQKEEIDFELASYIERISTDICKALYEEYGIYENEPDSLYDSNGRRKPLPTVTDFYKKVLIGSIKGVGTRHEKAYGLILDNMKDNVRELYYYETRDGVKFLSKHQIAELKKSDKKRFVVEDNGEQCSVIEIKGTKPYFDGQSTVALSIDCPFTDFDISSIPRAEQPVVKQICNTFISEFFVKKNSQDLRKARKLVVIYDENNESYPFLYLRRAQENQYRTNRAFNVCTLIIQQALSDGIDKEGTLYPEVKGIHDNTAVFVLFKQPYKDTEFLKKNTVLTDAQVERVISLGGGSDIQSRDDTSGDYDNLDEFELYERQQNVGNEKEHLGEMCVIDGTKVGFCKFMYFKETEQYVAETDAKELRAIYEG